MRIALRFFAIAIAATAATLTASAMPENAAFLRDSIRAELARTTTTADSLRLLTDMFDLSTGEERTATGFKILDMSENIKDKTLSAGIVVDLANIYIQNDSVLSQLYRYTLRFPDSQKKQEALTFVSLQHANYVTRFATPEERHIKVRNSLHRLRTIQSPDADIYGAIELQGTVCIYLGNGLHPGMIRTQLEEWYRLSQKLPEADVAVRNLILEQSAQAFSNLSMPDEAVAMLHRMVVSLDKLKASYHAQGRRYADLDASYFMLYRLMMQNYEGLDDDEIEEIYRKVCDFAKNNPDVAHLKEQGICDAYYLMSQQEYAKAIPLLKKIIDESTDRFKAQRALKQLITAAEATGNKALLLEATTKYSHILEAYISNNANEVYSEMQVIYDVNALQTRNTQLELEQAQAKMQSHRRFALIAAIVLAVMLIVMSLLLTQRRRLRNLADELSETNMALINERDQLEKAKEKLIEVHEKAQKAERHRSDFIRNMRSEIKTPLEAISEYSRLIVDCTYSEHHKFLRSYADTIVSNIELLETIVDDVLDIGDLDDGRVSLQIKPVSVLDICRVTVKSVRHLIKPDVSLVLAADEAEDVIIRTDNRRVEQVLFNLLGNAAKFTEHGSIVLDFHVDKEMNTITFSVSDTGPGIPEENAEKVFERFYKANRDSQGVGLGLSICKMIADLLHGTVRLDTIYAHGSRFLFTIPMSYDKKLSFK